MSDKTKEINTQHWVLVSQKTGKVASGNNWLLALTARAQVQGHTTGIASLLPHNKAKKALSYNKLTLKTERKAKLGRTSDIISKEAIRFLPELAAMFVDEAPKHKPIFRKDFCKWIARELADETSEAYQTAIIRGFEYLVAATSPSNTMDPNSRYKPRSERWWLDQIKKMQS